MKKLMLVILALLLTAAGCSNVSTSVSSEESQVSSVISEVSEVSEVSSAETNVELPSCVFCLTTEYTFEVDVMTTTDWQSFDNIDIPETKTFTLTFPESWIRDAEGASTFHNQYTDIKIFESVAAVKLSEGFDFAGSFTKENFEDPIYDISVVGDITIGTLTLANGEITYAMVVQSVVPEGGGDIQLDLWYPYFFVVTDGEYAYCMQFYSLDDPASDDTDAELFLEIMSTFSIVS